jgi:DNA-binding response OmpR family regulator
VLRLLVQAQHGAVVSRDRVLDAVWGADEGRDRRRVDTQVLDLGRKLEADPASQRYLLAAGGTTGAASAGLR